MRHVLSIFYTLRSTHMAMEAMAHWVRWSTYSKWWCWIVMWGFPKIGVPPSHHPFLWHSPLWTIHFWIPPCMETPNSSSKLVSKPHSYLLTSSENIYYKPYRIHTQWPSIHFCYLEDPLGHGYTTPPLSQSRVADPRSLCTRPAIDWTWQWNWDPSERSYQKWWFNGDLMGFHGDLGFSGDLLGFNAASMGLNRIQWKYHGSMTGIHRKMRHLRDWKPVFSIARRSLPLGLQVRGYFHGCNHANFTAITWDMGAL